MRGSKANNMERLSPEQRMQQLVEKEKVERKRLDNFYKERPCLKGRHLNKLSVKVLP